MNACKKENWVDKDLLVKKLKNMKKCKCCCLEENIKTSDNLEVINEGSDVSGNDGES